MRTCTWPNSYDGGSSCDRKACEKGCQDEREARERVGIETLKRVAATARREANEILELAPAESMYLCSIAQRLELKVARLSKK